MRVKTAEKRRYMIRLPTEPVGEQDSEWCELLEGGQWQRLRLHDYGFIFDRPGLYEQLFSELLCCQSPQRVVELLAGVLRDRGMGMETLNVLDVGAGNGMVGQELRTRAVGTVVGIDILEEAALAAERDRAGTYDDYVIADLTRLDETDRRRLARRGPNALTTVAALGFGDMPPEAFAVAFNLLQPPGWVAFNIRDAFLNRDDASGFSRLIHSMVDRGYLQLDASRRYVHRRSVSGREIEYVAFVGRKLHDLPMPLPPDIVSLRRRPTVGTGSSTRSGPKEACIRLEGVSKLYPGASAPAIDTLASLHIAQREMVAIVGGSGSGKTTLLKLINRLVEPSSGSIWVNDQRIDLLDVVALRRSIGYVFQQVGLFPHLTVADNIAIVPRLLGWRANQISERVDELLTLVGLSPEEFRLRRPRQLSGGQQQRVGFARALAARPQILLMDEPFGALDPVTRQALQQEMAVLHRQLELTSVLVTHDMAEALLLADRVIVMQQGRILRQGTPAELLASPGDPYVESLLAAPTEQARRIDELTGSRMEAGDAK